MGRRFGWEECPSVTESLDNRKPQPRRLIHFIRWASDLKTVHRCCTSATRDCSTCKDGAAHMSWIMVNKREHMNSDQRFTKLDRSLRDVRQAVPFYSVVIPNPSLIRHIWLSASLGFFFPQERMSLCLLGMVVMASKKAVILGYDAVSPLGTDLESSMAACGRRGLRNREINQISAYRRLSRCAWPGKWRKSTCGPILFYSPGKWRTGRLRSLNTLFWLCIVLWKKAAFQ